MKKSVFLRLLILSLLIITLLIYVTHSKKDSSNKGGVNENKKEDHPVSNQLSNQRKIEKSINFEDAVFPDNFFFGSAYSDFQTAGISPTSDWHEYINGLKPPAVGPGIGNDLFNRYREDFDLAGEVGIQVHRMSLEWSRIEPQEGKWDMAVIRKYREMFRYMQSRGVKLMICLNHFPHPKWFADKGGWESPKASYYYARYAELLAKELGLPLKVKWWLTFNEPQFVISIPYGKGSWPPFKPINNLRDNEGIRRFMLVASNVMDGHRLAYRAIHKVLDQHFGKNNKVMVGFASAPGSFYPSDPDSPLDQFAHNIFDVIYALSFDSFIGNTDRDFIGLNYYGRTGLRLHISLKYKVLPWLDEEKPLAIEWVQPDQKIQGERPKEVYPQALYDLIMKFKPFGLPIVITENGLSDPDDKFREEFIVVHLKAIHDAIRDGANVIGYQYWALADTWEPGDNSFSQMGLIAIDRQNNLERRLRPSSKTYGGIIRTKKILKELLEKHKELLLPQN